MWQCSKCGETHEDGFDACWNCLTPREGAIVPVSPSPPEPPEPEAPRGPAFRMPSLRWLGFVPRVVIAWVLVAPWVYLHLSEWYECWFSWNVLVVCTACSTLYVAGAVQRRNRRHLVLMLLLGAGVGAVAGGLIDLFHPHSLLWQIFWPALMILPAAVAEWFLICRRSRGALVGVLLAGVAAAAVCAMVQPPLVWLEWRVPCPTEFGSRSCSLAELIFWPVRATLLWLAVPLGLAADTRPGRAARFALGAGAAAILAAYVGFYGWGVYELGERSLAGQGPFSRRIGVQLVAHRGRPSDYEMIWQTFLDRDDAETARPDWSYRSACIRRLMEYDPQCYADRLVQLLRASPNAGLARLASQHLAEQRAYEAAPVLARYAMRGEAPCVLALEEMGIPQAAMGLVARVKLDWVAEQWPRICVNPRAAFQPGENALVDPAIRKRLVAVMGTDAGPRLQDWVDLYDARIGQLPSPLSPAGRDEVDRVVACCRKNWRAVRRWRDLRRARGFRHADLMMEEDGRGKQLEALKRHLSQTPPGQPVAEFAEGDPLVPVFLQWTEYFAETHGTVRIRGTDWNVPTTQALEKEVDAFVRRVDNAWAEFAGHPADYHGSHFSGSQAPAWEPASAKLCFARGRRGVAQTSSLWMGNTGKMPVLLLTAMNNPDWQTRATRTPRKQSFREVRSQAGAWERG